MDYWILVTAKYLHVVFAAAWVGGGMVLFFLGLMAARRNDDAGSARVIQQVVELSPIWFIPTSILTFVFGLVMTIWLNLWGQAWIIIGLLGFLGSFLIGFFILKPTSEEIEAARKAGLDDRVKAGGQKMLTVSKFDYTLLLVVIADMVYKPQWNDWLLLLIFVAVLGAAGYFFLYPTLKPMIDRMTKRTPA